MDPPPVQYVKTSDGYNIAYAVSGHGIPLIFKPSNFDHIQLAWRFPGMEAWLEGLSARYQLIQFDPRGSGMSTRNLPDDFVMNDYLRDIEAVIEKLNLERFILLGAGASMTTAFKYAVEHPGRVIAIVIAGAVLSGSAFRAPAQWQALPEQDWELFLYSVVPRDRNPDEARRTVELLKQSYDQRDFVLRMRATATADDSADLLMKMKTPTLVLHARDYALLDATAAIEVAQLCGGRMVLIDGNTVFGDAEQGLRAMDSFLSEVLLESSPALAVTSELSTREVEVLRLIVAGRSNQQIADNLVISLNTVRRHVSNIFDKTSTVNRAEAISYAHRVGLV